jgi:glycosidase
MMIKKSFYAILLGSFIFQACTQKNEMRFHTDDHSIIWGLASPVQLEQDTTTIHLTDFVVDAEKLIDSIGLPKNYFDFELSADKKLLKMWPISTKIPQLNILQIYHKKTNYSVLLKSSMKVKIELNFEGTGKEKLVQLKGEMNSWNQLNNPFQNEGNRWKNTLYLLPGRYEYLLVIDGKEITDPKEPETISNGMGGFNSVLKVGSPNPSKPEIYTASHEGKKIFIHYHGSVDSLIIFWENYQLLPEHYTQNNGIVTINPPHQVNNYKRSYYRIWAYNSDGISNDLLIPLDNGRILVNAKTIDRTEHHGNIIYNIMIDRFVDGNKENTKPLNLAEVLPKADYFGGDLEGITDKIVDNYFYQLGVNSLWISPIIRNPKGAWGQNIEPATKFSGYHGYWPISFTQIDERFGTPETFTKLINSAHVEKMNIYLDYVANHVHQDNPVYAQHPDWFTKLELPDGTLNLERWETHRLTTWFDKFLPTIDFSKPEVIETLTDSAVFWMKKYPIDGFRHDATKHIQTEFWQTLTYKLKTEVAIPENRQFYQIGETYGSPELINSYVSTGLLNAQFDFNIYDALVAALAIEGTGFKNLKLKLEQSLNTYGYHNLMGYITGNQDRPRFISLADASVKFNENTKLAGWTRKIEVLDTIAYQKLSMLTAFVATIPGIPVIFYGDEFGMPGANDPDCRRMMRFGKDLNPYEQQTLERSTKILDLRKHTMPLIFGTTKILIANEYHFVLMRQYFDEIAILVLNNNADAQTITFEIPKDFAGYPIKSNFNSNVSTEQNTITINIKGNYFDILTK